jgi:hypothetical protein
MDEVMAQKRRLRFVRRPSPVLAEHRPLYKIAQLLMVLQMSSRGGKSTLARLHLFNWALKRMDRVQKLVEAAQKKSLPMIAWGFDPALAIAIQFAIAEELVHSTSTGYQIADRGKAFIVEVLKDAEIFGEVRGSLAQIGKNITETMVGDVAKGWEKA